MKTTACKGCDKPIEAESTLEEIASNASPLHRMGYCVDCGFMGQFKPKKTKVDMETPWNEGTFTLLGIIAFFSLIGAVGVYFKRQGLAFAGGVLVGPMLIILIQRFSYYRRLNQSEQ